MANLARIINMNATVRAEMAPSLNAAFSEIHDACNLWPVVLNQAETAAAGIGPAVSGGSRTLEESYAAGSGPSSDHYEDNALGHAAVDINNQRTLRNILGTRFESILAAHGWRNIDISGNPFPVEPWHFANHDSISQAASAISAISLERLTDMSVLHIHPVINADQYKLPFLLWNEVTFAATGLDQHARDNLVALGVAEGAPVTSMQVDEADTFRAAVWNAKLLPGK